MAQTYIRRGKCCPNIDKRGQVWRYAPIRFVAPRNVTIALVASPLAMICAFVMPVVRATVAMDFIGWTHIGTLKCSPVMMFDRPEKMRVAPRLICAKHHVSITAVTTDVDRNGWAHIGEVK